MRTQSNTQPTQAFQIEKITDTECDVLFYENVEEVEKEEQLNYEYDMYRLPAIYREELSENIEANYELWLNHAKRHEAEYKPQLTHEERTQVLEITQSTQDEEILTNLLASAEIFELVLSMYPMSSNAKQTKGVSQMVEVYVTLIVKGQKTLEDVPAIIRPQVEAQLKVLGIL